MQTKQALAAADKIEFEAGSMGSREKFAELIESEYAAMRKGYASAIEALKSLRGKEKKFYGWETGQGVSLDKKLNKAVTTFEKMNL